MSSISSVRALTALTGVLMSLPAAANAETAPKFTAEFSAGILADSDVGIADLDQTTREGDLASVLGVKFDAELKPASKITLRAGYELADTRYQEFDAFNLQTHRLSAEGEYAFGATRAGLLYNHVDARLSGENYLTFRQASPYVTHLFGDRFLLRGAYARSERDFETETGRNSTGHEVLLDGFILLDGAQQFVVLGAKGGEIRAGDAAFSYDNTGLKARYVQKASLLDRDLKLRIGTDFEQRDYTGVTPELEARRRDETRGVNGGVSVPIAGPLSLDAGYEYRARSSNLEAADYQEHLGTVQLKLSF